MLTDRAQQALAKMGGMYVEDRHEVQWPAEVAGWFSLPASAFERLVSASCAVAAGEDKARLDWLQEVVKRDEIAIGELFGGIQVRLGQINEMVGVSFDGGGVDLRAAVDAARSASPERGDGT